MSTEAPTRQRGQHRAAVNVAKAAVVQPVPFKRLPVGATFNCHLGRFRKIAGAQVFRVNANGRGQTNAKLPFARNTKCTPEKLPS